MKATGKKKKTARSKPKGNSGQYLLAAGILLAGVAVSALLLTGVIPLNSGGGEPTSGEQAGSQPSAGEPISGEPTPDTPESPEEPVLYTVRFYDGEEKLLTQCTVTQGYSPDPPEYEVEGLRFRGWDKDIFFARSDLDLYPRLAPLGEGKNIVYANAVYADRDESICVTPRMAGTVDCCSFTIEVSYDALLLDYTGADTLLTGVTVEDDAEQGILTLSWGGDTPLTQASALAALYFSCAGDGCYTTTMNLVTREIHTLSEGNKVYTESKAFDFEVFILNKK